MSLEAAIADNTKALNTLISLYQTGAVASKPTAPVAAKAESAKPVPAPVAEVATPVIVEAAAPIEASSALTYDDITKPFLALVNSKGRPAAEAVLKELGVPLGGKLSAVTPENYAKALEVIAKASA
ncbi:MAG: hypothetical protein WCS37_20970 [Chloroflexota bacterium]